MSDKYRITRVCQWWRIILPLLITLHLSLITSCGSDRRTFLLEGTFKGFNQGELYIYGVGGTHRLDTIGVVKGKFRYEIPLEEPVTFSLVFPNFSELPVFGETNAEVEIEGDASHLRETRISGTDLNKEMTNFRLRTSKMPPPEITQAAEAFIREQPASPISLYLLGKYFTQTPEPDYDKAIQLIKVVQAAQPDNTQLKGLAGKMKGLKSLKEGAKLPAFTVTDINGKTVKSADLNAPLNIITVWAKWNYESLSMQRQLDPLYRQHEDKIKVLSICLDADVKGCKKTVEKDSVKWSTVCSGQMWETPLLWQLGLSSMPDNILTDSQGKIIAHGLKTQELLKKVREQF